MLLGKETCLGLRLTGNSDFFYMIVPNDFFPFSMQFFLLWNCWTSYLPFLV